MSLRTGDAYRCVRGAWCRDAGDGVEYAARLALGGLAEEEEEEEFDDDDDDDDEKLDSCGPPLGHTSAEEATMLATVSGPATGNKMYAK